MVLGYQVIPPALEEALEEGKVYVKAYGWYVIFALVLVSSIVHFMNGGPLLQQTTTSDGLSSPAPFWTV